MAFLTTSFELLTNLDLELLTANLLASQILTCFLQIFNLNARLLLCLSALLDVLLKVVPLVLQLLTEFLNALAAILDLLGHAVVLFNTRG